MMFQSRLQVAHPQTSMPHIPIVVFKNMASLAGRVGTYSHQHLQDEV